MTTYLVYGISALHKHDYFIAKKNQELKTPTNSSDMQEEDFGDYYFSATHFVFLKSSYFLV